MDFDPSVWFFPGVEVKPIRENVWQVGERAVCKRYTDKTSLAREIRLYGFLEERGLPVPSTLQTVDELDWFAYRGSFYHLTTRLPGAHVQYPLSEPERFGALYGDCLRRLHDALAECPFASAFPDNDLPGELEGWFCEAMAGNEAACVTGRNTAAALRRLSPALPRQLIHRDPHPGNLLFKHNLWTGVIDCTLARRGYRLLDIAYLLSSVLSDGWTDEALYRRWLRFAGAYLDAYRPTDDERAALGVMLRAVTLLFAGYRSQPERRAKALSAAEFFRQHESDLSFSAQPHFYTDL